MNTRIARLAGAAVVVAVLATACGSDGDESAATRAGTEAPVATMAHDSSGGGSTTAADTAAATLRAGLTSLLQEHVYLAGITTGVALSGGDHQVPAAVLDENSQALAAAVGSVYGDAAGTQFLELWRTHIGFFVDYTVGRATGDQAKVDKAKADLDGYRADFGAFLAAANPHLTKDAVADELKPHVDSLFAAIDAQAAKSADAVAKLRAAAAHMPTTAAVLAGAIVEQFPNRFGDG